MQEASGFTTCVSIYLKTAAIVAANTRETERFPDPEPGQAGISSRC